MPQFPPLQARIDQYQLLIIEGTKLGFSVLYISFVTTVPLVWYSFLQREAAAAWSNEEPASVRIAST